MTRNRRPRHPKSVCRHCAAFNHEYRSTTATRHGHEDYFPRQDVKRPTVHDLVYEYLGKCANQNVKWMQQKCACNKFNRQYARRRDIRGRDVATTRPSLDEDIAEGSRAGRNVLLKRASRSSSRVYIADYTKAVRDGRRRAKLYVRDALLYGMQSGLLIPINRRKNLLRVSQELEMFSSRNDRRKEDDEDRSNIATSDTEYSVRT